MIARFFVSFRFAWLPACVILLAGVSIPRAQAQCSDATTHLYSESSATRLNGNTVKLYNQTYVYGNYSNLWYNYISSAFYLNGALNSSQAWGTTSQIAVTVWQSYERTLQTYGAGQYYTSAWHNAYAPACNQWFLPNNVATADQIQISRPARPDYQTGWPRYLWWFGNGQGITFDGQYFAQTLLAPGGSNGAPESPTWVVSSGSNKLSLDCANCTNPLATATGASSYCQAYDVVVNTSYGGFLSDPLFIFINRPWNLIASNDQAHPGWCGPGGGWVYSCAKNNGYETHINYETKSLCSSDPSMTNYHIGEQFTGGFVPDYAGTNWGSTADAGSVPVGQYSPTWFDNVAIWNYPANPGDPAYCNGVLCIPQFTNPGMSPHTLVQHLLRTWLVGSPTIGLGLRVQTDTLQNYTDSGWHTAITTPVP